MSFLLSWTLGLLSSAAFADVSFDVDSLETRQEAMDREILRALELSLPEQPEPYLIRGRMVTGSRVLAEAEFGALSWSNLSPIATAGIDMRVGDSHLDNGNFDPEGSARIGGVSWSLPVDSVDIALRRELWLAMDQTYKGATEQYAAKVAAREGAPRDQEAPMLLPSRAIETEMSEPRALSVEPLETLARDLSSVFSGYPSLERGRVLVWSMSAADVLVSTEGPATYRSLGVTVILAESLTRSQDGAPIRALRSWVSLDLESMPSFHQLEEELEEMLRSQSLRRDAPVELDYLGPVIFEGPAAVELFRQLLLPELCGTPPAEVAPDPWETRFGSVAPRARPGRRLLPDGWSVDDVAVDHPELPGGIGSDLEGQPTRAVGLVRDGVVQDVLMSRVPRVGFAHSTGHGRVVQAGRVLAAPGVVEVQPQRTRRMRRLERRGLTLARQADLPYVLVVRQMVPLSMVEEVSVAFSADARLPGLSRPLEVERLYRDGRREPVRGLSFVGVDRRALRDIDMAGPMVGPVALMEAGPGDGRFSLGETRGIPTSWSAPSVLIAELELRGGGGQELRVLPPPP